MRDRDLIRLHWPVGLRGAFDALFSLDQAMAEVVVRATQPALAAIKLAWWREQIEALDRSSPPAEPRLQAVATELLPRGLTGADLAGLEDGHAALLEERYDADRIGGRGVQLFAIAGRLLGASDPLLGAAGRLWAIDAAWRAGHQLHFPAAELHPLARHRFPRPLRPLTAFACLAARDVGRGRPPEPEATPGRAAALVRHRLTGRL